MADFRSCAPSGRRTSGPIACIYAKALLYPVAAAPFVRIFGLKGFLVFHTLLLAAVAVCGYLFLAARSSSLTAMLFTLAFLAASVLPAYTEFLAPEILNFALVFLAYFLCFYREVQPGGRLGGLLPQVIGAILLGLVTYSKPTNLPLIAPIVLLRPGGAGSGLARAVLSAVFLAVVGLGFGFERCRVTGEFNYQGGNIGRPWTATPDSAQPIPSCAHPAGSVFRGVATDGSAALEVLTHPRALHWFVHNLEYFLFGRHFGFVPYFFPGSWRSAGSSRARGGTLAILIFGTFVTASIGSCSSCR